MLKAAAFTIRGSIWTGSRLRMLRMAVKVAGENALCPPMHRGRVGKGGSHALCRRKVLLSKDYQKGLRIGELERAAAWAAKFCSI